MILYVTSYCYRSFFQHWLEKETLKILDHATAWRKKIDCRFMNAIYTQTTINKKGNISYSSAEEASQKYTTKGRRAGRRTFNLISTIVFPAYVKKTLRIFSLKGGKI